MPPAGNCFFHPIGSRYLVHDTSIIDQFRVGFLRNKVGVSPFLVQVLQIALVTLVKGNFAVVTLAPCGHDKFATGLQDTHHLVDVFLLVGHVFSTLAGPHNVKGVVGEAWHFQGILDHEFDVRGVLFDGQFLSPFDLFWTQGDGGDFRLGAQCAGEVSGGSTESATYVENLYLLVGFGIDPSEFHHFVDESVLGLFQWSVLVLDVGTVVAQMDVLTPVIFKNSFFGPFVVFAGNRSTSVGSRRFVQEQFDESGSGQGGGQGHGSNLDSNLWDDCLRRSDHGKLRATATAASSNHNSVRRGRPFVRRGGGETTYLRWGRRESLDIAGCRQEKG
mmetsp:Transcript_26994/g.74211  ORF Transcript_26994/g.74211 Transcript_26994/m.74211 type:complete len:332 (-) Transcript_26994:136-1131(-)